MNEAILPPGLPAGATPAPGVYADLAQLLRLRQGTRGFSFLPRQPLRSVLAGCHASRLRGRGLDFDEIRRYQPGDDIRQMDWKVTARTRIPHCRIYTEEHGRSTLLVVDQRLSMFFGSRLNFKSVTAAETAALAAWRVIAAKDRLAAIIFGDADLEVIPAGGSTNHVMRMLGKLLNRNRALTHNGSITHGPQMLNAALKQAEHLASHDTLVLLITDGSGHDAETRKILSRIAAHNDVLIALISDPLEMDLPDAGSRVFGMGGLQLQADTSSKSLRENFHNDYSGHSEQVRKFLIQREVPLMPISTAEPVTPQFRRLLGKRTGR